MSDSAYIEEEKTDCAIESLVVFSEDFLGPEHYSTLKLKAVLAQLQFRLGKIKTAESILTKIFTIAAQKFGPVDVLTLEIRSMFAVVYMEKEDHKLAFENLSAVLQGNAAADRVVSTILTKALGIVFLIRSGAPEKGPSTLQRCLDDALPYLSDDHPLMRDMFAQLFMAKAIQGDFDGADQGMRTLQSVLVETKGSDHIDVAQVVFHLAKIKYYATEFKEAERLLQIALVQHQKTVW